MKIAPLKLSEVLDRLSYHAAEGTPAGPRLIASACYWDCTLDDLDGGVLEARWPEILGVFTPRFFSEYHTGLHLPPPPPDPRQNVVDDQLWVPRCWPPDAPIPPRPPLPRPHTILRDYFYTLMEPQRLWRKVVEKVLATPPDPGFYLDTSPPPKTPPRPPMPPPVCF